MKTPSSRAAAPARDAPLIAVDWGTSSLRGARLDANGAVLEQRAYAELGILGVRAGEFRAVFDACFGDWMRAPGACALIAGMAGSRQGWVEAAYAPCPAAPADLAQRLAWIEPGRIAIVPGLACEHDGVPDVMRGEEVQVYGALALCGNPADAWLVLPGTHSKWVRVESGRIAGFTTAMTGEVYALLRRHSILARTLPTHDDVFEAAAFDAGVAHARRSRGLLEAAFSARTLALFERQPMADRPSYLSGLVIGEELRGRSPRAGDAVIVVGAEALTERYARALASFGVVVTRLGAEATWRGLHQLAHGAYA